MTAPCFAQRLTTHMNSDTFCYHRWVSQCSTSVYSFSSHFHTSNYDQTIYFSKRARQKLNMLVRWNTRTTTKGNMPTLKQILATITKGPKRGWQRVFSWFGKGLVFPSWRWNGLFNFSFSRIVISLEAMNHDFPKHFSLKWERSISIFVKRDSGCVLYYFWQ